MNRDRHDLRGLGVLVIVVAVPLSWWGIRSLWDLLWRLIAV